MADFLKPKETPEVSSEQMEETGQTEQEAQKERVIEEMQEKEVFARPEETIENAGRIIALEDEIQSPPGTKSERLQDIEKEMSKDLEDVYKDLDSDTQKKVEKEGEEASREIEILIEESIETGQDISKKAIKIVRDWMREIHGVNRYFLEQESKRKTDRILALMIKSRTDAEINSA